MCCRSFKFKSSSYSNVYIFLNVDIAISVLVLISRSGLRSTNISKFISLIDFLALRIRITFENGLIKNKDKNEFELEKNDKNGKKMQKNSIMPLSFTWRGNHRYVLGKRTKWFQEVICVMKPLFWLHDEIQSSVGELTSYNDTFV